MRVLVTGASGFIGQNVLLRVPREWQVFAVYHNTPGLDGFVGEHSLTNVTPVRCDLTDAASRHWERLPAPSPNAVTRRAVQQVAGPSPLGKIGARGAQGLIHLDTVLCQPRRCFECPIAAAELSVNG